MAALWEPRDHPCTSEELLIKGSRWAKDPVWLDLPLGWVAPTSRLEVSGSCCWVGTGQSLTPFLARLHLTTPTSAPALALSQKTGLGEHWKPLPLLARKVRRSCSGSWEWADTKCPQAPLEVAPRHPSSCCPCPWFPSFLCLLPAGMEASSQLPPTPIPGLHPGCPLSAPRQQPGWKARPSIAQREKTVPPGLVPCILKMALLSWG